MVGVRWTRCEEVRCVGMGREVDLSFNSLCSLQLFLKGKKRKIGQTSGKTRNYKFHKKGAKVVFFMWGLIILNCTIKTRMIYFGVAEVFFAE